MPSIVTRVWTTRSPFTPYSSFTTGVSMYSICCFFFQAEDGIRDLTVTGVQTCALPIWKLLDFRRKLLHGQPRIRGIQHRPDHAAPVRLVDQREDLVVGQQTFLCAKTHLDRKSTRLNSSHSQISYAVFCLKKKKKTIYNPF